MAVGFSVPHNSQGDADNSHLPVLFGGEIAAAIGDDLKGHRIITPFLYVRMKNIALLYLGIRKKSPYFHPTAETYGKKPGTLLPVDGKI
jgi:hypothetical protein